jgi:uncharacterized protein (TIGR02118 family)
LVKWIALYRKPEDTAAFDSWFLGEQLEICRQWPDVEHMHVGRITGSPRGESEYYWIFEAVYKDQETMMASLMSEKGMEAAMNARQSDFGKLMASFFVESVHE